MEIVKFVAIAAVAGIAGWLAIEGFKKLVGNPFAPKTV